MPKDVDECVQSVLDDNPDMDESTAFAICNSMKNKGQLADFVELLAEPPGETAALAQFRNPGDIQRVEEGGAVRYKRVMLLSPGTWTDAGSEQTVDYSADGIRASAENWVDIDTLRNRYPDWSRMTNPERVQALRDAGEAILADDVPINFLHGPSLYGAESLDEVGHIPTDSVIVDDQGRLYADIVFHQDTPQSETAVELMDEVLKAAQTPGSHTPPVGPSVEIPADDVSPSGSGVHELQEAWFSATGIVFNPASRPVELGTQAAERAVAMTSAETETQGVIYRSLQTGDIHRPEFTGTITGAPDEFPGMDDFDTDDLGTISDHALASTSGFPPADFDDILGFVVTTDGDLSLPLMREVAASIASANLGDESTFMARLSREQRDAAAETLQTLAEENFGEVLEPDAEAEADDDEEGAETPDTDADAEGDDAADEAGEGDTLMAAPRHRRYMSGETDPETPDWEDMADEDLARTLEIMQEDMAEMKRALQSPDEMQTVSELAAQFADEAGDDASVQEMVAWMQENTDVSPEAIQGVLEEYLAEVEADSLGETPVSALQEWLAGELSGADEGDGEESADGESESDSGEGDGEGEGDGMDDEGQTLEELQQVKSAIGEFAAHMNDIKDMLQAKEAERQETIESLERRLAEIEDEPVTRSLTGESSEPFVDPGESNGDGSDGEHEELYL